MLNARSNRSGGAGAVRRLLRLRGAFVLRSAVSLFAVVAGGLVLAGPGSAGTVNVSNTEQLQNAVSAASSGDTIVLAPGTYAPDATLDVKVSLTITGPDRTGAGGLRGAVISGINITHPDPPDVLDIGSAARVTLKNLSVRLADRSGTAIDVSGSLDLENSEVSQNNSAISVLAEQGSTVVIRNSTISDNQGIGVDVLGNASLFNATIAANRVSGLYDESGTTAITNTIVAKNGDGTAFSTDCFAPVDNSTSSIDGDGSCGANLHGDPKLGPLEFNGGPTLTRALQAGSPGIDRGSGGCAGTDQRLAPRVGACDIGAFEYGATPPAAAGGSSAGSGGSQPPAGGTSPGSGNGQPPTTGGTPSGQGGGKSGGARPSWIIAAKGAIKASHGLATFTLHAVVGHAAGVLVYDDSSRRIRLRSAVISTIVVGAHGHAATARGFAQNTLTKHRVAFTIVLGDKPRSHFRIHLSSGYTRSGRLVRGAVWFSL